MTKTITIIIHLQQNVVVIQVYLTVMKIISNNTVQRCTVTLELQKSSDPSTLDQSYFRKKQFKVLENTLLVAS